MTKKERFAQILAYFQATQPVAETELNYSNPFELLVAVILSAQCTDKRVNMVTPELFRTFPTAQKMAEADADELFEYIRSISYPNAKAKHLAGMARMLVEEFGGIIPEDTEAMQRLPGVGRKTANVIASVVFHAPKLAVDTHVFRVSARLGLTIGAKTPLDAETQLVKHIPQELIPIAHHWLILHGRYTCIARKPLCNTCTLGEWCKSRAKYLK